MAWFAKGWSRVSSIALFSLILRADILPFLVKRGAAVKQQKGGKMLYGGDDKSCCGLWGPALQPSEAVFLWDNSISSWSKKTIALRLQRFHEDDVEEEVQERPPAPSAAAAAAAAAAEATADTSESAPPPSPPPLAPEEGEGDDYAEEGVGDEDEAS
jgi:hypothetical protein